MVTIQVVQSPYLRDALLIVLLRRQQADRRPTPTGHVKGLSYSLTVEQKVAYDVPLIGGKDCPMVKKVPEHKETFKIGDNIQVTALHTPCHTQDSICYLFEDGSDRAVFTGDTLFIDGTHNVKNISNTSSNLDYRLRTIL